MDRDEHLAWAKRRALEYLDRGEVSNAIASMGSDMEKHDDFKGVFQKLFPLALTYVIHNDHDGVRRFIEGFR
jgi:hypothetical protein